MSAQNALLRVLRGSRRVLRQIFRPSSNPRCAQGLTAFDFIGNRLSHVARFLNADSLSAHRFGNLGEVGTLEVHSEGNDAGLLLFDLDEVKCRVVEDDLNHWSFSFYLCQEIAKIKQTPVDEVIDQICANTCALFDLPWS